MLPLSIKYLELEMLGKKNNLPHSAKSLESIHPSRMHDIQHMSTHTHLHTHTHKKWPCIDIDKGRKKASACLDMHRTTLYLTRSVSLSTEQPLSEICICQGRHAGMQAGRQAFLYRLD